MRVRFSETGALPVPGPEAAPYLNWLYRWPFVSPVLAIARSFLNLEQRVWAESAVDTVADLLVSSEPIETPICLGSQAMHLTYLICLLAAGQSLECCIYESKQKNTLSIGAYHYHARQALMGWDSAFLTIFQNLADIRELLCGTPVCENLVWQVLADPSSLSSRESQCGCETDCLKWHLVGEILEHLFYCRITVYEMEYVARSCGFSLAELEQDFLDNDLMMSPISFAVVLDNINVLGKIEQAVKESDLDATIACLGEVASYLVCGQEETGVRKDLFVMAPLLLAVGRVPRFISEWFAFGTSDMVDTCVNDIPVKPYVDNMDRWDSMKRDLKNVTEAMVGILPSEDVVNRFTSFLDSKNNPQAW